MSVPDSPPPSRPRGLSGFFKAFKIEKYNTRYVVEALKREDRTSRVKAMLVLLLGILVIAGLVVYGQGRR
jgi:hypothetical protein